MDKKTENNFINIYNEVADWGSNETCTNLYKDISNKHLKGIFIKLHYEIIRELRMMNTRLPTSDYPAHFWADNSRNLLSAFDVLSRLKETLDNTELKFNIDEEYLEIINTCKGFLNQYLGSSLPPNMNKITIYTTIPIFFMAGKPRLDNIKYLIFGAAKTKPDIVIKDVLDGNFQIVNDKDVLVYDAEIKDSIYQE